MYKPAKHVSFDADKKEDRMLMIRLNALAAAHGRNVAKSARHILIQGIDDGLAQVGGGDEYEAMKAMGM